MSIQLIEFNSKHISRLTNHIGICQHANYHIPNYHQGYCLDDNARALQLLIQASNVENTEKYNELIETYLAYILYMQKGDGQFHNFLSFDLKFLDTEGTPDAFGRCIMALGSVILFDRSKTFLPLSVQIFKKAKENIHQLKSVRAIAYTMVGLIWAHQSKLLDQELMDDIRTLANYLLNEFNACGDTDWHWFEEIITYDNAIIPYALLATYEILPIDSFKEIAIKSIFFLDEIIFSTNYLKIIGNSGWYAKGDLNNKAGEQPIEIPSLILMYNKAKELAIDQGLLGNANKCYDWFFGHNQIKSMIYNPITKGCHDGFDNQHVNQNQGAESTISFWQAYLYYNYSF